jgi:rod shape-determining protein MreC
MAAGPRSDPEAFQPHEAQAMIDLFKRHFHFLSAMGVLLVLLVLLSLRWSRPESARWIDATVQTIAFPFQTVFHGTSKGLTDLYRNYIHLVDLKQENDRLRLQVDALQEELNHYINSSIQFNLLREQLKFLEDRPERKVFAEVMGESVDAFHHVLIINKGSQAGIRRNFPVVLREGVVGRIQSTSALSSVVQLIVDRRHRFPVLIQRSRERMVLQGDGGNLRLVAQDRGIVYGLGDTLRMNRIRMLADVEKGDRVVTSGLAGIFPKGMLVGTITSVGRERHELFQTAEIQPVVDFNRIEGVFVILKDASDTEYPLFTDP